MEYYSTTETGLVREINQDSYITCTNEYGDLLAIVADGIGGGPDGEIASSILAKYFYDVFIESGPFTSLQNAIDYIGYHIDKANRRIYQMGNEYKEYKGMGTTITGVLITSLGTVCFNCGDSRTYGLKDKELIQLTNDDTLVNQMIDNGEITSEEADNHPKKHYLLKAMGIYKIMDANIYDVKDYDYYLICSDGLHGYVDSKKIIDIVYDEEIDIETKVKKLINEALLAGGYDNITVILIKK